MTLDSFSFTSKGGREENQDTVLIKKQENGGLFLVADGLGGYQRGKEASECVANAISSAWDSKLTINADWMTDQIERANRRLLEECKEKRCTMKSTVVALSVIGKDAVWAHTGDSRLYGIRKNKVTQLTNDHSVAFMKYKTGTITKTQIAKDEDQSALLRAIGTEERWKPDTGNSTIAPGDAFMLCSDGMWEYITDDEILIDYLKSETAEEWGVQMLRRIMERITPGNDNLTVLTLMIGE